MHPYLIDLVHVAAHDRDAAIRSALWRRALLRDAPARTAVAHAHAPGRGRVRALRIRLGHALITAGAAIEGGAGDPAAPLPSQRAAA
jgi:hypothetical protein